MRLRSINGLRCKQFKLVLLAFFIMFILWKWEEGTYYNTEDIHPDSLVVSHPANSKFVDQRTSSDEDFPSVDSLPQPVVKVGKQVTGAPPPVPLVGVPAIVGGEQGASPSKSKGNYLSSMTVGGTMDSFLRMLLCIYSASPSGYA
ncbi:unnamed protein product [Triticum turgidum subsp. durum]|uniref:Uncharacterized protein n=1 Tax=Triticum turgidum subsp. durum TaxID=4567 RepID=A0A9R0RBQ4_TRITD|nr:unnamed protein product [Triticum turgidum subsp. durum]